MDCVICDKELGDDPFEQDGATFKLHKECVTEELQDYINELLRGYIYVSKGKNMRGFFHKPHEELK